MEKVCMNSAADRIRGFILENFLFNDKSRTIGDDESFLESGIIDSTGVIEVVAWIEENYNFSVDDEDLVPEKFDSVGNLAKYIDGKVKAQ